MIDIPEIEASVNADRPMPNLFLVGAPKCGTTSLHHYLSQHPDVFMARKKEPHFWSTDLYRPERMTAETYFALFTGAGGFKYRGEASTEYIYSGDACRHIKRFFPDAIIVIMLRNPVDKIYSGHAQRMWRGWETVGNLEDALRADNGQVRRQGARADRTLLTYRESASYAKHVRRYIDAFGWDQVHVVLFEDFKQDAQGQFANVCRFLKIPSHDVALKALNARKEARVRSFSRMLGPKSALRLAGKRLPPRMQGVSRAMLRKASAWNTRYVKPEPIPHAVRMRLEREFSDEVAELSVLLGRNLEELWFRTHAKCGAREDCTNVI